MFIDFFPRCIVRDLAERSAGLASGNLASRSRAGTGYRTSHGRTRRLYMTNLSKTPSALRKYSRFRLPVFFCAFGWLLVVLTTRFGDPSQIVTQQPLNRPPGALPFGASPCALSARLHIHLSEEPGQQSAGTSVANPMWSNAALFEGSSALAALALPLSAQSLQHTPLSCASFCVRQI